MPIYEYVAPDGTRLELIRPAEQADAPVQDPEGKGRQFKRALSTFAPHGANTAGPRTAGPTGGCCPCGKNSGQCSRG